MSATGAGFDAREGEAPGEPKSDEERLNRSFALPRATMPEPFYTSRLVEFHDTDMAGIMHFASFFVYMESAEHEMLRSLGLSVHTRLEEEHLSFPRVAATCSYSTPARCEEVLDVTVAVTRIGVKSVTYGFRFTREGREVATGSMTAVCCRFSPGQPPISRPIPAEIADKLRTYLAPGQ